MVTGENDKRIRQPPIRAELVEHSADLLVDVIHHCVINRQLVEHIRLRARPRQQRLIAALEVAVVERMLGLEILRQFHFRARVFFFVAGRIHQRIVRAGEIHVQKKRLFAFAIQKFQRAIGNVLVRQRREADALLQIRFAFGIFERPISITRNRPALAATNDFAFFPSAPAAAEEPARFMVTSRGGLAVIHPFAAVPRVIPAGRHRCRPKG